MNNQNRYSAENPCKQYNNGNCSIKNIDVGTWFEDPCVSCETFEMQKHHKKYNIRIGGK